MLDHLDDIASDMSVLHRVDDIHAMDGARFFTLVPRLPAYPGVMQVRVQAELAKEDSGGPVYAGTPNGNRPAAVTPETAAAHRGLQGDGKHWPPVFEQLGGG